MIKSFVWKLKYAVHFSGYTNASVIEGWRCASAWEESFGIEDYTPLEAVYEDLSCWGD